MKSGIKRTFALPAAVPALLAATVLGAHALVLPAGVAERRNAQETAFVAGEGFERVDPKTIWSKNWYTKDRFPNARQNSALLPDNTISSVVRAVLVIEKQDTALKYARYRITIRRVAAGGDDYGIYSDLIEVSRFNLGPVRRAAAKKSSGGAPVGPKSAYGIGPNVAWRFAMRQMQGHRSTIDFATRHVMSDHEAASARCFETPCLALDPVSAPRNTWKPLSRPKPHTVAFEASDGINATPAMVADTMILRAAPNGLRAEPGKKAPIQMTLVISKNVTGQDDSITGLLHQAHVRDDAISDIWLRRNQAGPGAIAWQRYVEHWPGRN